jgi:hypothetical protein
MPRIFRRDAANRDERLARRYAFWPPEVLMYQVRYHTGTWIYART